jgi:hypothetical protein
MIPSLCGSVVLLLALAIVSSCEYAHCNINCGLLHSCIECCSVSAYPIQTVLYARYALLSTHSRVLHGCSGRGVAAPLSAVSLHLSCVICRSLIRLKSVCVQQMVAACVSCRCWHSSLGISLTCQWLQAPLEFCRLTR